MSQTTLPADQAPAGKTSGALRGRPRPSRRRRPGRERRPLWLMWPVQVLLVLIVVLPLAFAVWISLLDLDQYTLRRWLQAPFVGLSNYREALAGEDTVGTSAARSLWISTAFSVLTTLLVTPIGILAALSVNATFRGRGLVRSIYLLPYVLPSFVTALLWRLMYTDTGVATRISSALGLPESGWLVEGHSFWALVITDVWASWAFVYMMTLAGLQTIHVELFEAAEVDGTTWWQRVRHVVLPGLRGVLGLALLLSTLHHFNNFTLPFVMFGTPSPDAVNVLPVNVFTTSFHVFRFGLGAAMSVLTLVVMLVPGYLYFRAVRLDAAGATA